MRPKKIQSLQSLQRLKNFVPFVVGNNPPPPPFKKNSCESASLRSSKNAPNMPAPQHLLQKARARRSPLPDADTDILRLLDGSGDGAPGLFLDTFAGRLLLSTRSPSLPPAWREALAATGQAAHWKRLDQNQKDSPAPLCGPPQDEPFTARESGLRFEISFRSGYSQGIFPDQRLNRALVRRLARETPAAPVLNTFAYTGAFSVAAAAGGAETTTLDLSRPYLHWAKRNLRLNHLDPAAHHFCKGDAFHWLRRFAQQGRRFQGIILDPPTFSRDDKGKVFRAAKHYHRLAALAAAALAPGGWLLCCANDRRLTPRQFRALATRDLPRPHRAQPRPMPPEYTAPPYLNTLLIRF